MIPAMHNAAPRRMRVGVDLGGTKIEAIALDDAGRAITRRRIDAHNNFGNKMEGLV